MEITRELVRDPVELVSGDGRRFATQRWITKCSDLRHFAGGLTIDCGWINIGPAFPTPDSVASPQELAKIRPWWRFW